MSSAANELLHQLLRTEAAQLELDQEASVPAPSELQRASFIAMRAAVVAAAEATAPVIVDHNTAIDAMSEASNAIDRFSEQAEHHDDAAGGPLTSWDLWFQVACRIEGRLQTSLHDQTPDQWPTDLCYAAYEMVCMQARASLAATNEPDGHVTSDYRLAKIAAAQQALVAFRFSFAEQMTSD